MPWQVWDTIHRPLFSGYNVQVQFFLFSDCTSAGTRGDFFNSKGPGALCVG